MLAWALPLNMLLATAPQGAMGSPFASYWNGAQYELGAYVSNNNILNVITALLM